jgi:hypothetical protein
VRNGPALRGLRLTPKYEIFDRHLFLVLPVTLRPGARLLTYVPDGAPVAGSFEDSPEPEIGHHPLTRVLASRASKVGTIRG